MWTRLLNKARFLFRRGRFEAELAEEIEFHRAMLEEEEEKARQGLGPQAAAAGAERRLGDTLRAREHSRDWIIIAPRISA